MAAASMEFPECCRYCPHRSEGTGACTHELRQSLISQFSDGEVSHQPCPVFMDWRAAEMAKLAESLED